MNSRRPRRRFGRVLIASLAALLLLGFAYETIGEAVDLRRYPPPGKLVDLGGYSMHLDCIGQGSPTVILEGGLFGGVVTWPFVQSEVAQSTRVCSYDRSGWGWSGGSAPESGHETAARLHTLLDRAGEKGPYVLVGHSLGGLYNQLYTAAYPDEVAGMVLVEARHQEFAQRLGTAAQEGSTLTRVVGPVVIRLGLVRLLDQLGALPGFPGKLPPGMVAASIRSSSLASALAEQTKIPSVEAEVRAAHVALGAKPLIVITRDHGPASDPDSQAWFETQRLYLSLSTSSRLIEAQGSGHMVPYDRPEVVTEAIGAVLKSLRS